MTKPVPSPRRPRKNALLKAAFEGAPIEAVLDEVEEMLLLDLPMFRGLPRNYVIRTGRGELVFKTVDLIIANQIARLLGGALRVFKSTTKGEVLMAYRGC